MTRYRDAAFNEPKTTEAREAFLREHGYELFWRSGPGYQLSVSKGGERFEFSEPTCAATVRAAYEGVLERHGLSMHDCPAVKP